MVPWAFIVMVCRLKYLQTLVNIYHLIRKVKRKTFYLSISTLKKYPILDDN